MPNFEIQVLADPVTAPSPPILWRQFIVAESVQAALAEAEDAAEHVEGARGIRVTDGTTGRPLDLRVISNA
jgi:hypothetical protein